MKHGNPTPKVSKAQSQIDSLVRLAKLNAEFSLWMKIQDVVRKAKTPEEALLELSLMRQKFVKEYMFGTKEVLDEEVKRWE